VDIVASCDAVIMNLILHNVEDTMMQFFLEYLGYIKIFYIFCWLVKDHMSLIIVQ